MFGKVRTCVLNLPMNEGQGHPHDSSEYGNNGMNNGADWVSGDYGWAMNFNGSSDNVNCSNDTSLDCTDAITIGLWMKSSDVSTQFIISKYANETDASYEIYCSAVGAGGVRFRLYDNVGGVTVNSNCDVLDDIWHRIICVLGGTTMSVYVDGALKTTGTLNNDIKTTVNSVIIGVRGDSSLHYDGLINGVIILNRPWSSTEVMNDWNATKARYGL